MRLHACAFVVNGVVASTLLAGACGSSSPSSPANPEFRVMTFNIQHGLNGAGLARGRMDGITHKSSCIDYVFYVPGNVLELRSIENISTAALIGTEASDHNPLVATFAVK